ncbi:hypothetical protein SAMN05428997_10521 [Bosea sp. CRIB-10]|uniref:DUF6878 family protein n=1 Tax=Bosea sp. CRIB-10 TaxID=378404 RepID=UPI0008EC115D|nr:DUF6878 family protein [Bosea sp. CRIB-10]SFC22447.1 hypothetical protein SAMN05428997_10521 [Bosea sp. CRIB-10]
MSKSNSSTEIYVQYERRQTVEQDDAKIESEMKKYRGQCVNSGTFLATGQRDHAFVVPGIFDELMCRKLEGDLSQALGIPVLVTTRYEDTDLGRLLSGAVPRQQSVSEDHAQTESETTDRLRETMLKSLAAADISEVELTYDGYGDEGHVEEIDAWNSSGDAVDLNKYCSAGNPITSETKETLHDLCEEWLDSAITGNFPGWEINDGSRGVICIDVAEGKVTCDHSWRVTNDTRVDL